MDFLYWTLPAPGSTMPKNAVLCGPWSGKFHSGECGHQLWRNHRYYRCTFDCTVLCGINNKLLLMWSFRRKLQAQSQKGVRRYSGCPFNRTVLCRSPFSFLLILHRALASLEAESVQFQSANLSQVRKIRFTADNPDFAGAACAAAFLFVRQSFSIKLLINRFK